MESLRTKNKTRVDLSNEYFSQFRDVIFIIDQTGKILYKDPQATNLSKKIQYKFDNIVELFPDFLPNLKEGLKGIASEYQGFEFFEISNFKLDLFARCYSLANILGIGSHFLITIYNTKATNFMVSLLGKKPKEYIKHFTSENIKQFIYLSNEIESFVEILNYTVKDFNNSILENAVNYILNQLDYFRKFYSHQAKLIQDGSSGYLVKNFESITVEQVFQEMRRSMPNNSLVINNKKDIKNIVIRGEKNWIEYAFRNIAFFITSNFPQMDPINIEVNKKSDRNQVYMEIDFGEILNDNLNFLFDTEENGDLNMFYNCYKLIDMNRGNLRFKETEKKLIISLPLYSRGFEHDNIIFLMVDSDWKSRKRLADCLRNLNQNIVIFESGDPQEALRMMNDVEPDIVSIDPYFYLQATDIKKFIETIQLSMPMNKPELIIFSQFNNIFDQLADLDRNYQISYVRKEITDTEVSISLNKICESIRNFKALEDIAQNARRASEIDSLTGLFNRAFYDQLIKRELKSAEKNNISLGLIIADIDNFKHYNDINGHLAGDHLLRDFAKLLKDKVRTTDYISRYGGEEFVIVLINPNSNSAFSVANKLRRAVEQKVFLHEEKQPEGRLTASFGVSNFPIDAKTAEDLFKVADKRLYQAKGKGRNTVV